MARVGPQRHRKKKNSIVRVEISSVFGPKSGFIIISQSCVAGCLFVTVKMDHNEKRIVREKENGSFIHHLRLTFCLNALNKFHTLLSSWRNKTVVR